MYSSKEKNQHYTIYNPKKDKTNIKRFRLSNDLRKAIDNNELELYYQPQINTVNNDCNSFEALIRWHHPENGIIPPDDFIPLAEHTGLIISVSEWVLNSALKQISDWRKKGFNFNVAVNLSSIDVQDASLPSRIKLLLDAHDISTDKLIIEVTETAMMLNVKNAKKILQQIHDIGIKIALDDFGTGYSSLNHLRHFPIDEVKIDRSFISSMISNKDDYALVKAIIDLSHDLNIAVVAEGVETLQEVHLLNKLNCDRLQGYHFSKPIPAQQVISSLKEIKLLNGTSN
jgi:EAL domain-containing protein (putative c-di-GMP-specific phosphodiesterase class I)